jgi:2-iminobutanoate/2-iminopropanoate deaminase
MKECIGQKPRVPYSAAVKVGGFIFVSGQLPTDANGAVQGGIREQTALCLDKVKAILEEAGSSMDKVVKTTVYITDKADFAAMNEVYVQYFPENRPSRACVVAGLVIDAKIEIEAVALQ